MFWIYGGAFNVSSYQRVSTLGCLTAANSLGGHELGTPELVRWI
jgi:hypothetical protein